MRPKTKDNAQRIALTLSAPARAYILAQAKKRGVSRTQVVEDLIEQKKSIGIVEVPSTKSIPFPSAQPVGASASQRKQGTGKSSG